MTLNEYIYLLASHLIVADGEINQKELDVLSNISDEPISEDIRRMYQEILSSSDEENRQSLDWCIDEFRQLSSDAISILFEILFKIAYADGYYDDREKNLIEYIAKRKCVKREQVVKIENDVVSNLEPLRYELPWTDNLKSIVGRLISALRGEDAEETELISGGKFIERVRKIAIWAEEDIRFAESEMRDYNQGLRDGIDKMEHIISKVKKCPVNTEETKGLVDNILHLNQDVMSNIVNSLNENLIMLNKKKRTIPYFTIAFMGRTKAGKSTFHKVVTHEQEDDIGVGKQRTTRHNRSWYWENLRIIDTPGIGAAGEGGRTDEEVAKSIIDEADLICYIVTNDSVQETEFNFLEGLKERNKPLFIILNVKNNLDNTARLNLFLKDPLKWKNDKGPKCIDGHIQRIIECIGSKYDFNNIEIIPLQLLAAKLYYSNNTLSREQKCKLLIGSEIKTFITAIKKCVYDTGNIKKTQNIIDGCGVQIHLIEKTVLREYENIEKSYKRVSQSKNDILNFINKEYVKVLGEAIRNIDNAHLKMKNNANQFAEIHCEDSDSCDLGKLWVKDEGNGKIYDEMNANIDNLTNDFVGSVNNRMEELMSDIEFLFSFDTKGDNIKGGGKTVNTRLGVGIVGSLVTLAVLCTNPFGWGMLAMAAVTTAIGFLFTRISFLFKSKEEKRREKIKKLRMELERNIEKNKENIKTQFQTEFEKSVNCIKNEINTNFSLVLNNANDLMTQLRVVIDKSKQSEEKLNKFFVYRIIQHLYAEKVEPLLVNSSKDSILSSISVERNFDFQTMHIFSDILSSQDDNIISKLTQLKVTIN